MYRRILVTLDGSPLSEAVLPRLEPLVSGTGASVTMLRVAELPPQTSAGMPDTPAPTLVVGGGPIMAAPPRAPLVETRIQASTRVRDEIEGYLNEKAIPLRGQGIGVDCVSRLGHPADEIIDYAGTHDVDMIVMSTHGRTGLRRMLFGSVAGRVLLSGVKPVLLVRPEGLQ